MRRRRKRRPSRVPTAAIIASLLLIGAGVIFTRIYPNWKKLRFRPIARPAQPRAHSRPPGGHRGRPHPVAARLYFVRVLDGKERLVAISRELPGDAPAGAALAELIQGEVPAGCLRPLPQGVRVRGIRMQDGLAIVDFSQELVSNFEGGSESEGVTVYSVVNTLTSLPTIERVQILVEGKPVDTIGGHLDISGPLGTDNELVVR